MKPGPVLIGSNNESACDLHLYKQNYLFQNQTKINDILILNITY